MNYLSRYKNHLFTFIFIILIFPSFCQAELILQRADAQILIAEKTNREYKIFSAWPKGPAPKEGWPVIYVLDANIMFLTMVETARMVERHNQKTGVVVIGVGYRDAQDRKKERALDLTARVGSAPNKMLGTGGAEDFLQFIEQDLKPYVNKRFTINHQHESIFGHSFGGHFVLYSLINKPTLFDNFIAASPSIWFEDKMLTLPNVRGRLMPKLQNTQARPRSLITVGEYEQKADPDFPPRSLVRINAAKQVDNAREYAQWLVEQQGVSSQFSLLAGENHGTVIPAAISRAVRFIFSKKACKPKPADKHSMFINTTSIQVPTSSEYSSMSKDQRFKLRTKVRTLPKAKRIPWLYEFKYQLDAGLTYGVHRAFHEEKVFMDNANELVEKL